jgi:prephenate dehydratase
MNRISKRVAFQGERGAFSEQAAHRFFSPSIATMPVRAFEDVFRAVERGRATHGIVPIENSLFGSVHQSYDLLQRRSLKIVGEITLRIVHALLVNSGSRLEDVRTIYSHPQALGQCEGFLHRLKRVNAVAWYDTAGAARMVREEGRNDAAAIASVEAARVYGLKVLRRGIESDHQNFTRFLVLARAEVVPRRDAKTSIVFTLNNIPGALFRALSVFALRDIDLYKIESRPVVGKPWEYLFYVDIRGSIADAVCQHAIDHLSEIAPYIKILGSYTAGRMEQGTRTHVRRSRGVKME